MIPTTIHHIWTGPAIPEHLIAYMGTFAELHPDWEHRLWTDHDDWTWLENYELWERAPHLFPRNIGQFRSDVARLEILRAHGGVYVDCDMEALRPLDDLLGDPFGMFAGWERQDVWLNNAIVGAVAGHPFLDMAIGYLPESVAQRPRRARPAVVSGPQFLTPLYRANPIVTVHPERAFYPYSWDELDQQGGPYPPESFTAHHWHNRRTNR